MTDEELEILAERYLEHFNHHIPTGRSFVDFGRNAHFQFTGIDPIADDIRIYGGIDLQPIQITRVVEMSRDEIVEANRQFDADLITLESNSEFERMLAEAQEHILSNFYPVVFGSIAPGSLSVHEPRISDNTEKAGPAEQSWKDWLKESADEQKIKQSLKE